MCLRKISLPSLTLTRHFCDWICGSSTQSKSDTNCLNVVQNPKGKGTTPQDSHPCFRCQLQVVGSQVTHNFCPTWLQIKGSHSPLPGFDNLLPEPRKTVYSLLLIYYKGCLNERPGGEIHGARSGRVPGAGASVSLGVGGAPPSRQVEVFTNLEALHTLFFWNFYGDFNI